MNDFSSGIRRVALSFACLFGLAGLGQALAAQDAIAQSGRDDPGSLLVAATNADPSPEPGIRLEGARDPLEVIAGYDESFAPMSKTERDGEAGGFAVEVFRLAAQTAGLHPKFVGFPSFSAAVAAMRSGKTDVVLTAVDTEERRRWANFVGPYYTAPTVLVTSLKGGWPSLSSLSGKQLAIDQGHYLIPALRSDAPDVVLVEYESVSAVMEAVSKGTADAGVTNLEVAANYINDRYLGKLQISGTLPERASELSFMVRKDMPQLARQLQLGLASIPPLEKTTLANTLLRTKIEIGVTWKEVLLWIVPICSLLTGLLLASAAYGRRLSKARSNALAERDLAVRAAADKADFLAEMGHEIRAPLAAIAGGLRLVKNEEMPERTRQLLRPIVRSTERLVGLLNRLLDLARLEAGKLDLQLQPLDLRSLIEDVVAQFQALAGEKQLTLTLSVQEGLPSFELDPFRVQQVLNNLISNAVKFSDRGTVTVSLTGSRIDAKTWELRLSVADEGAGMSPEMLDHLFEKYAQFSRDKRSRAGTGLGLAISRAIVVRAGGEMTAKSKVGVGTTFDVKMKVKEATIHQSRKTKPPGKQVHVLLVDDDPVILLLCTEFLRRQGCEVDCVDNYQDALSRMKSIQFDILVTDQSLQPVPGENGIDLVLAVATAAIRRPGKIYMLSGESKPQSGLPPNLDGWLQKPRGATDRNWLMQLGELVAEFS